MVTGIPFKAHQRSFTLPFVSVVVMATLGFSYGEMFYLYNYLVEILLLGKIKVVYYQVINGKIITCLP